jgi:hypothetical protein
MSTPGAATPGRVAITENSKPTTSDRFIMAQHRSIWFPRECGTQSEPLNPIKNPKQLRCQALANGNVEQAVRLGDGAPAYAASESNRAIGAVLGNQPLEDI